MKRLLLLALAVTFAACSPDIPTGPNQSNNFVVAEFDPANGVIPLPNDLVAINPATGLPDLDPSGRVKGLHAPETGGTDAQNEFNRDYLNLLDGFPMESTASVTFSSKIDVNTVDFSPNGNVVVYDITDPSAPFPFTEVTTPPPTVDNKDGSQTLLIIPKGGYWTRNHHYSVLVVGGANGLKGAPPGQTVTGSATWALGAEPVTV